MTDRATTPDRIYLLDANVLIAIAIRDHAFHDAAHRWLSTVDHIALCPVVEGALVRFLLREGETGALPQPHSVRSTTGQRSHSGQMTSATARSN